MKGGTCYRRGMNLDPPTPPSSPPAAADVPTELLAFLETAKQRLETGDRRQAASALCTAEMAARQQGRHREAAQLRQAIGILAQGGRPKLLFRGFS